MRAGTRSLRAAAAAIVALAAAGPLAASDDMAAIVARDADRMKTPWSLTTLYTYSDVTNGRPDRNELDVQLYSRVAPNLTLGARVDPQRRSPDTDTSVGVSFYWAPLRTLEWYGSFDYVNHPTFLAEQTFVTGFDWRVVPQVSLLLGGKAQDFPGGWVNQVIPGVSYWFSDETWVTARYASGRAYGQRNFDSWTGIANIGTPNGGRVTLAYSHGADPELDPDVDGVVLTDADTYTLFYRHPLKPNLDLLFGLEYEDRTGLYNRTSGSIGITWRF